MILVDNFTIKKGLPLQLSIAAAYLLILEDGGQSLDLKLLRHHSTFGNVNGVGEGWGYGPGEFDAVILTAPGAAADVVIKMGIGDEPISQRNIAQIQPVSIESPNPVPISAAAPLDVAVTGPLSTTNFSGPLATPVPIRSAQPDGREAWFQAGFDLPSYMNNGYNAVLKSGFFADYVGAQAANQIIMGVRMDSAGANRSGYGKILDVHARSTGAIRLYYCDSVSVAVGATGIVGRANEPYQGDTDLPHAFRNAVATSATQGMTHPVMLARAGDGVLDFKGPVGLPGPGGALLVVTEAVNQELSCWMRCVTVSPA